MALSLACVTVVVSLLFNQNAVCGCVFVIYFLNLQMQEGLDDESFESYRSGLTAKLLEKDSSLSYETSRFWNQIVDNRYYLYMILVVLNVISNC